MFASRRQALASLGLLSWARAQAQPPSLTTAYRAAADRLIDAAIADESGYRKLAFLCDRIGNRLSGSPGLEKAVAWAAGQMREDGLANVSTPAVKVPRWVRGQESAALVTPVVRSLTMLGLGNSIGTPADGITAEVVPVASFEDLDRRGRAALAGRIVLYNVPYQGYGRTVAYRVSGATRAAAHGAAAVLVRSVGSASLQTPHTGVMQYGPEGPRIPAAAVTWEDAALIQRLADAGEKVTVRLRMAAQMLPDADSANVVGEVVGRERPEEVVVMGGHLDSWDVGQGAQDDGSGCVAAMQAVALVRRLGLQPRRTLRVALWTNEENGLAGGNGYRAWVGDKVKQHVAGIEMDGGAEKPLGFGLTGATAAGFARAQEIGALLARIGAGEIGKGGGGADIGPLMREGMPGLGLRTVGTHYFDWHHTEADTLDKIDPKEFRHCTAALAVMGYVLADMPGRLTD